MTFRGRELGIAGRGPTRFRPLGALRAQRLIDLVGLRVAPALTSGLIAYSHFRQLGPALLVFGAMLAAARVIERSPFPLQLMPAARVALALFAPAVGAVAVLAIMTMLDRPPGIGELVPAVIGAWLVFALGGWTKARLEGSARARVAVIGSPQFASDLRGELRFAGVRAYEVIGWLGPEGPDQRGQGVSWLGSLDQMRGAVLVNHVDLFVCAADREPGPGAGGGSPWDRAAQTCMSLPVRMIGANQFYEDLFGHTPVGTIDQAWYRYVLHPNFQSMAPLSKRLGDIVLATAIGVITLPLLALGALAIKLQDRGPVLYRQRRLGEHGRQFEILKLRSMAEDAEADGLVRWSDADDDRATRVGRVLRRTHIDELPQLWNVLRGDMTLVGPRPERPEVEADLERQFSHYTRRHLLRPGITGWAQLRCGYAGSDLGAAWKLCHDLYYIKHRSMLADLLIIFETAFVAFRDAHRALRTPRKRFIVEEGARG
ncbi:MAG: exopolysaccharide biosynthesis polyprenyl glycosylphosphotransferase [bacterium]